MPKTSENLLLKYWDKALLAALAVVLAYVFFTRVLYSPIDVNGQIGAKAILEQLDQKTDDLEHRLQDPNPSIPDQTLSFDHAYRLFQGYDGQLSSVPLAPISLGGNEPDIGPPRTPTPQVLAPTDLQTQSGLGILALQAPTQTQNLPATDTFAEMSWVTVAAKFPFYRQYLVFAGIDPNVEESLRLPQADTYFLFARLELQRQELQADGSWSRPKIISNPYELYSPLLPETVKALQTLYSFEPRQDDLSNLAVFRGWLSKAGFQEFIARPEFLPLASLEQWLWPQEFPSVEQQTTPARLLAGQIPASDNTPRYRQTSSSGVQLPVTAPAGYGVYGRLPTPSGYASTMEQWTSPMTLPTVRRTTSTTRTERVAIPTKYLPEQAPETIDIWAHDASADPGKTYRYQMRVLLFNPLCGKEAAENKTVRRQAWLTGRWSEWSQPVRTLANREFFFTGIRKLGSRPPAARVHVYAYHQGWWYSQQFTYTGAGQEIGSPKKVPPFVLPQPATRALIQENPPGLPQKIEVDFSTGWQIDGFNPEMEMELPIPGEPGKLQMINTGELVVTGPGSDLPVKRYDFTDKDDPLKRRLDQIIERQEEATATKNVPPRRQPSRSRQDPRRRNPLIPNTGPRPMGVR